MPLEGVGDHADRAGRRDGGDRGVAPLAVALSVPGRVDEVGERAARGRQFLGGAPAFVVDELHHVAGQRLGFGAVVGQAQVEQHVGPAHHAQPNPAVAVLDDGVDFLQREVGGFDHVVQEPDGQVHVTP